MRKQTSAHFEGRTRNEQQRTLLARVEERVRLLKDVGAVLLALLPSALLVEFIV